jgi:uncharacterized protein (DUF2345 family)
MPMEFIIAYRCATHFKSASHSLLSKAGVSAPPPALPESGRGEMYERRAAGREASSQPFFRLYSHK